MAQYPERQATISPEPVGLPAGHAHAAVSKIASVAAVAGGTFYDENGDPVEIAEQDADVAKMVAAYRMALTPALNPTGWHPTKEAPAQELATRTIVLNALTDVVQLAGRVDDRRRLYVSLNSSRIFLGPSRESVENAVDGGVSGAFAITGPTMIALNYAGELWVKLVNTTIAPPIMVHALGELGEVRNMPDEGSIAGDSPDGRYIDRSPRRTRD